MGQQHSYFSETARDDLLGKPVKDVLLLNRPLTTLGPNDTLLHALKVRLLSFLYRYRIMSVTSPWGQTFRTKNISCAPVCKSKKG